MDSNQPVQSQAPITSSVPPVSPVPPVTPPPTDTVVITGPNHRKVGPIIAILVIVVVLVIAAIYLFAGRINKGSAPVMNNDTAMQATDSSSTQAAAQQSVQPVTNASDDISSMEADLNTSTNGLDEQNF